MYRSLSFVGALCLLFSLSHAIEYSFDDENYKVLWTYDNATEVFHFRVEVKTDGWVGFGISRLLFPPSENDQFHRDSMDFYDVLVAGKLDNGSNYFTDYLTDGWRPPSNTESQDWIVDEISKTDGKTILVFQRKKDTGDVGGDNVIGPGFRFIVWAYHTTLQAPEFNSTALKHSKQGTHQVDFFEEMQPTSGPRDFYNRNTPTTGASAIAASIIGNFFLFIIAFIFFY